MGNSIPKSASQIFGLATNMNQGLITLGSTLKITQITPAQFAAELDAFTAAESEFNAARSAKQAAADIFKPADAALAERLQVTRNILAGHFGVRWSTMWAQAGFVDHSTAVPVRIEQRLALALNLANFFTALPSYEVASMGVTAADLTTLRQNAVNTRQSFTAAEVALKGKGDAWDTAWSTLTGTMKALIRILEATLKDNDPRWLTFGLQMPSAIVTPGKPLNLTVKLHDTGALLVLRCDRVPLANRYRWRMRYVAIETEYRLVARSTEPLATLSSVRPGQAVEFIVQAVNDDRQGVASDPVVFAMPAAQATGSARSATAEPHAPEARVIADVNGSNVHANGSRLPELA